MDKKKLVRITTVPLSLDKLLDGQLRFMNQFYDVIAVSSEKEYLDKIGVKENVSTYCVEMTRKITPIQDVISVLKLFLFLRKTKPFIVHTHTPKAGIVGMVAAKMAGIPNRFHTVAGLPLLEASGIKRKILDFVEKLTYSCATKVYPNSKALQHIINQNKYCSPSKLKVIGYGSSNGIDTSYFDQSHFSSHEKQTLKKELGISENDFVFIFVGRIVADKGINEMVGAFSTLQNQKSNVKLLLVGSFEEDLNPLKSETMSEIKSNPAILMVGFKNDVRPYLAISNALVFPSYREGFPNVVMQAGAMILPCIVTNINGCNEIIIEGENGTIIPVKDENALHEAMFLFSQNNTIIDRMAQNSRPLIVSRYEQKVIWKFILEEYRTFEK